MTPADILGPEWVNRTSSGSSGKYQHYCYTGSHEMLTGCICFFHIRRPDVFYFYRSAPHLFIGRGLTADDLKGIIAATLLTGSLEHAK